MSSGMAEPAATAGDDGPQTFEGLPLAWLSQLINDHLDSQGRLQLFRTGRAMCKAVLAQHDEGAQLSLAAKRSPAQQAHAQTLAAQAGTLAVKLQKQMVTLQACLRPCLTSLDLRKMTLPTDWAVGLVELPNLQILTVRNCQFPAKGSKGGRLLPALCKCTVTECTPFQEAYTHMRPLLAGSKTLTQLVEDDRSMARLLSHLPALTAIKHTPQNSAAGNMGASITAQDEFLALFNHPTLEHVVLGSLSISDDFSKKKCRWKTLNLLDGIPDVILAQLPVAGLDSLTVGTQIMCLPPTTLRVIPGAGVELMLSNPQSAVDNLNKCKQVLFKGSKRNSAPCPFQPEEPFFAVVEGRFQEGDSEAIHPRLLKVLQLCSRHVQGVLMLHNCTLSGLLASLPASVKHLVFAGRLLDWTIPIIEALQGSKAPHLKLITMSEPRDEQPAYAGTDIRDGGKLPVGPRHLIEALVNQRHPGARLRWQLH